MMLGMIEKLMTKRFLLTISGAGSVAFAGLIMLARTNYCDYSRWCHDYVSHGSGVVLILFVPVFILSVIFYLFPIGRFSAWSKFVAWFVPVSFVVILLTKENDGHFFPDSRSIAFGVFAVIFGIISLYYLVRKKKA